MFKMVDMLETGAPLKEVRSAAALLGAATNGFAERRMNASIQHALSGRTMDSLT
ncbi:hypothetical protein GALL_528590 [mine drainage metagenome]|uniref:Uncharacterized protein n=1 Tax=mine drainage metagenome TaxID=410659 RepID=A0A1J5PDI9_9ZZZZ